MSVPALFDLNPVRAGPIELDIATNVLSGPSGWVDVADAAHVLLRRLMGGGVVSSAELRALAFPPGRPSPSRPDNAIAQRMVQIRGALERVGVPGGALRNHFGRGYSLGFEPSVRAYSGARLVLLDRLLATHHDRAAAASLRAG